MSRERDRSRPDKGRATPGNDFTDALGRLPARSVAKRNDFTDMLGLLPRPQNYYSDVTIVNQYSDLNRSQNLHPKRESRYNECMRVKDTRSEIYSIIKSIDDSKLSDLRDILLSQFVSASTESATASLEATHSTDADLPDSAPKLWKDRDHGMNPVDFIKKYYADWIGAGLTRSDVGHLDQALYQAYAQWIRPGRGHEQDALLLPSNPYTRASASNERPPSQRPQVRASLPPKELNALRAYEAQKKREQRHRR